jgi:AraC family transcriptional regulator, regulatory protein of adaptative response / methylated-DNA-[protein]-cysteine methyltransferase
MVNQKSNGTCEPKRFTTDDERWKAVVDRDSLADGVFVYSVKTTGVYCRPVCSARLALRKNIAFHDTCEAAEKRGFRACKRCHPKSLSLNEQHAKIVAKACRLIEDAEEALNLEELAIAVGMSRYHFHRLFKALTGVTPNAYATAHRANRVKQELSSADSVTDAIYGAGFASNSRFYESSNATLGMAPKMFRAGGRGATIRFAVGESYLGTILVAASAKGICAISLGDGPEELVQDLQDRFPNAQFIGGDQEFEKLVAKVIGFVANPSAGLDLPLDIQGTAFQMRVWEALRQIPVGSRVSYSKIAEQIGQPKSVRAVAQACGANPLAVAIPCHRIVRLDGSLSGYRWGIERKNRLLQREEEAG